ncbi:MAG: tRNA-dihydrouridine synthase [Candidatus Paceibacterota bacterium]|jgi:nifR3 family TIM-barrel protein
MKNFWTELSKGFFCLAPMYDVTDAAFRAMFVKYSKPHVLFTEFVSADGLVNEEGRKKLLRELYITSAERPIVAQIFGSNPATIEQAVKLIKELKFDGVDINMGCPDRAVEKQGAGSALIKNPKLAQEIIAAAKRGARSTGSGQASLPVSVKTRLGYNKIDYDWIKTVLEAKPDAVTFHLRTRKEMSEAKAHYEVLPKIVEMFEGSGIPIIINGDIESVEQGEALAKKYKVDGVMIGRGAFGKPWLFGGEVVRSATSSEPEVVLRTTEEKLKIMLEHTKLFAELYLPGKTNDKLFHGHTKNFAVMRKHFKAYVTGFKGAMALRAKLMQANNPDEVEKIINEFVD